MDNISALSVNMTAPHGRAGPGTWGQGLDGGFVDFLTVMMDRSAVPAARVDPDKSAEPPVVMWTAPRFMAVAAADGKTVATDMDVENVVPPQLVDSQEDLIQLIALLLGEEDNDGFLFALRQYILDREDLLAAVEAFPVGGKETRFSGLFDLLQRIALSMRPATEEDLPPELAPLITLFAMFVPIVPTEPGGYESEPFSTASATVSAAPAPAPEGPPVPPVAENAAPLPEPVQPGTEEPSVFEMPKEEKAAVVEAQGIEHGREIPKGIDVTDVRITHTRRAVYDRPFPPVRPVPEAVLSAVPETEADIDAVQTETGPVVWNLTEQGEADAEIVENLEPAAARTETIQDADAPNTGTDPGEIPVPQAPPLQTETVFSQQTAQAAPARQVLASRIIEQITAQAAKPQDVSVLQMELNPKFLGRIQLVIEATSDGMTARLRSDNGSVRSLLNDSIAELRSSLREAGINMKDVEISESHIGAQLSERRFRQDGAEGAQEQKNKTGRLPAITAAEEITDTGQATAAYTIGRVSGYADDSQFDYRA